MAENVPCQIHRVQPTNFEKEHLLRNSLKIKKHFKYIILNYNKCAKEKLNILIIFTKEFQDSSHSSFIGR